MKVELFSSQPKRPEQQGSSGILVARNEGIQIELAAIEEDSQAVVFE